MNGTPAGRVPEEDTDWLRAGYQRAMEDPDVGVLVACFDQQLAGLIWLGLAERSALTRERVVQIDHLVVDGAHRHRGVGSALLVAAVSFAEERGVESVVTWTQPGDREGNRYFARLGFAPLVVRRIAPVSLLRRQLGKPGFGGLPAAGNAGAPPLRRRLRGRAPAAASRNLR